MHLHSDAGQPWGPASRVGCLSAMGIEATWICVSNLLADWSELTHRAAVSKGRKRVLVHKHLSNPPRTKTSHMAQVRVSVREEARTLWI